MDKKLDKFYTKTLEERHKILKDLSLIDEIQNLSSDIGNNMIENYIFNYELPLGLALNFTVDGEEVLVPMVIEEPSVVAAASNGAKVLGNIETQIEEKAVIGQIVLTEIENVDIALNNIETNADNILFEASKYCQSMINRGGGPRKVWSEEFSENGEDFISLYLSVDTCDAMGANTINTILESISAYIEDLTESKFLMRIISNNATESIVKARASFDISALDSNLDNARDYASRIEKATIYANLDPYRAATHNKGIMNGIDAVVVATGNDWRAIEAAAHTYAARFGKYKSLTNWKFDSEKDMMIGEIEIPLPVASLGGTISVHPIAKWSLNLLGNPSARRLASVIAAVGLAQNFSAVRAIVTVGIQKGHMSLHARSVAKQAGATSSEMDEVVNLLKDEPKINLEVAKNIINGIRRKG